MALRYFLLFLSLGSAIRYCGAEQIDYDFGSTRVRFLGKSPNFQIFPDTNSSSYLQLKFSKFEEHDVDDKKVNGHTVESLASANPEWTVNTTRTNGGTTYTWVKMRFDPTGGNSNSFKNVCPTNVTGNPFVQIYLLFGFNASVTFPYGLNKAISVDKGALKFTVEYGNWPFCAAQNTLYMEISLMLKGDTAATVNTSTASNNSTVVSIPLGNGTVSNITFANYAYEAPNGTRSMPVKVVATSNGASSQVSLRLPNPDPDLTVYYDPTVSTATQNGSNSASGVRLTFWTAAMAVLLSALLL